MNEPNFYLFPPIEGKDFPIYIELQQYRSSGELFQTHWHEHIEFIFMLEGTLTLTCNGKTIPAGREDLLIINANEIHQLQTMDECVSYYCIVFDTAMVKSSLLDRSDLNYIIPLANNYILFQNKAGNQEPMITCIKNLIKEYETKLPAYELAVKSHLLQLLTLLIRNCLGIVLSDQSYEKRRRNLTMVHKIIAHLNEHYTQNINLNDLAVQFNLSHYYLCHLFKEYTGTSILQYVTSLRISRAVYYLKNTDMSITEVALLVGFNDINFFSRVFKKGMKTPPSKYHRLKYGDKSKMPVI